MFNNIRARRPNHDTSSNSKDPFADDPRFAVDLDFDESGNLIEQKRAPARIVIGDGHAAVQLRPASGTGPGQQSEQIPPELLDKMQRSVEKIRQYKQRLSQFADRESQHKKVVQQLVAEIARLEAELAEEREHADHRYGLAAVKNVDMGERNLREQRRRREDARRQLASGIDMIGEEFTLLRDSDQTPLVKAIAKIRAFIVARYPLQKDLRSIEARYGMSVAAYFQFFRWICVCFIAAALIALGFGVKHIIVGSYSWSEFVNLYLPKVFVMSSYEASEALDYNGDIVLIGALLVLLATRKWIQEDLKSKALAAVDHTKSHRYSSLLLCAWDHSTRAQNVEDLQLALAASIEVLFSEDNVAEQVTKRNWKTTLALYSRRLAGILVSIALQGLAGYAIVQLTITSTMVDSLFSSSAVLAPVAGFIVPVAVSIINAMQPPILTAISGFEQWDDEGTYIKWLVWRLFTAKTLNVILQVFTFSLLADPYLFRGRSFGIEDTDFMIAVRNSAQRQFQWTNFSCRADQAGAALVQLVLTEFVVSKVLAIVVPIGKQLAFKAINKLYKKPEHQVAPAMVTLLYFTQLCLMSVPFSPLFLVFMPIMLLATFKFEKWYLYKFLSKPVRPWKAQDAGGFFVKFYLISLCISLFSMGMLITNRTYPKQCSVMRTTVYSLYQNKDPWCDALVTLNANMKVAAGPSARIALVAAVGGELSAWIAKQCPSQCESVTGATAAACAQRCSNIENIQFLCFKSSPYLDSDGNLVSGGVYHPCDFACGPFTADANGFDAISAFFINSGSSILSTIYSVLLEPAVIWLVAILAVIFACFKWNSLSVIERIGAEHEDQMQSTIDSLNAQIRKKDKQLEALNKQRV